MSLSAPLRKSCHTTSQLPAPAATRGTRWAFAAAEMMIGDESRTVEPVTRAPLMSPSSSQATSVVAPLLDANTLSAMPEPTRKGAPSTRVPDGDTRRAWTPTPRNATRKFVPSKTAEGDCAEKTGELNTIPAGSSTTPPELTRVPMTCANALARKSDQATKYPPVPGL